MRPKYNDFAAFKTALNGAKNIVALTGAGASVDSGVPSYRGPGSGSFWRNHHVTNLANLKTFISDPATVWEYYQHRRSVAFKALPNPGHKTLAKFEEECIQSNRLFSIITQNVDGLHQKAGSKNVLELHGALRKIKCTKKSCGHVEENFDDPICEALKDRGDPADPKQELPKINEEALPACAKCGNLARPYIVWFGENLETSVLEKANELITACDLCLVIGTSSMVYPAAMFSQLVADRGQPVAEFNVNDEPAHLNYQFYFQGPCSITLPQAFGYNFDPVISP